MRSEVSDNRADGLWPADHEYLPGRPSSLPIRRSHEHRLGEDLGPVHVQRIIDFNSTIQLPTGGSEDAPGRRVRSLVTAPVHLDLRIENCRVGLARQLISHGRIERVAAPPFQVDVLLRNKCSPRPRGHGFQRNGLTEALKLADEVRGQALEPLAVEEVVAAEILVGAVIAGADEDRVGNRDDRLLVPAASLEPRVLGVQVGARVRPVPSWRPR